MSTLIDIGTAMEIPFTPIATNERFYRVTPKPACECDYDAQGDPLEYVKCSHYCPLHDECESCGDCLGVAKDPTFPKGYDPRIKRAAWLCADCLKDEDAPGCSTCHTRENMKDADECWPCYDERRSDAEMFARHGGDA